MSQAKSGHFRKARKLKVCKFYPNVVYHWNGTCVSFKLVGYDYYTFGMRQFKKYLQASFRNVYDVSQV
jgi:hypothetical protein